MKGIILGFALLMTSILQGQIKPNFFPEDILTEGFEDKCFCKPDDENFRIKIYSRILP